MVTLGGSTWFATGDNVEIDDEGYVFYTGRADDIINSAGYRIGPQEVENALIRHPAVQECAVVGVPDDDRGEIVKAWVVLADGHVGDDDLVAALQAHAKADHRSLQVPASDQLRRRTSQDRHRQASTQRPASRWDEPMSDAVFETLERLPAYRVAEQTIRRRILDGIARLRARCCRPSTTWPSSSASPDPPCARRCGPSSRPG